VLVVVVVVVCSSSSFVFVGCIFPIEKPHYFKRRRRRRRTLETPRPESVDSFAKRSVERKREREK